MKRKLYLLAALLTVVAVVSTAAAGEDRDFWKGASAENPLLMVMSKLPKIFSVKAQSVMAAAQLPSYEGEVEMPEGELIYSWIEALASFPHRRPGTAEGRAAEELVRDKMVEVGLQNVTMDPVPITVWSAEQWSLTAGGEEIPCFFVVNTGFTGPEGVTAPLVYVGEGGAEVFKDLDVKGKIVVADVPFPYLPSGLLLKTLHGALYLSDPDHDLDSKSGQYLNFVRENFIGQTDAENAPPTDVYWNSVKNGAAGILLILKDQPGGTDTHYGPYDGIMKPLPGLWIGKGEGDKLRALAARGAPATLTLTGSEKPGEMRNIWGVLPGQSDEVILVTSHHDAPFNGAVEDGAGSAQVLAQAWAWSRAPIEKRPRTMVFVIDGGHFYGSLGGHTWAKEHQDIMDRVKILITLEHLGAKEVREADNGDGYTETGRSALTVMFTTPDAETVGAVRKALKARPARATAVIPSDFFGGAPTSDAAGYVVESGVKVISWIGCPYYLLDDRDTLDKIDRAQLEPVAETVAELVKTYMVMK